MRLCRWVCLRKSMTLVLFTTSVRVMHISIYIPHRAVHLPTSTRANRPLSIQPSVFAPRTGERP